VKGPGETAVSVSFLAGVAMTRVRSPFSATVPEATYTSAARHNLIDDHVIAKLRQMRIAPSPLSSDHVFIRRAYLDAAGMPTSMPPASCRPDRRWRRFWPTPPRTSGRA
jgi:hypothetical protein